MRRFGLRCLILGALICPASNSWANIDCGTPQGVLALMMAGAIDVSTAQCGPGPGTSISCSALSKLFLNDQGNLNASCAQRIHMHLYYASEASALSSLPTISTQPNWNTPSG